MKEEEEEEAEEEKKKNSKLKMIKIIITFFPEKWNKKKRNYNNILASMKWDYNKANK